MWIHNLYSVQVCIPDLQRLCDTLKDKSRVDLALGNVADKSNVLLVDRGAYGLDLTISDYNC